MRLTGFFGPDGRLLIGGDSPPKLVPVRLVMVVAVREVAHLEGFSLIYSKDFLNSIMGEMTSLNLIGRCSIFFDVLFEG